MNRIVCGFDVSNVDRQAVLAIPEHVDLINIEYEFSQDRKFESIFVTQECIDIECGDLRIFLHEYNKKLKDLRDKTVLSKTPWQIAFSKFHLFYHHNSVNNNKNLYGDIINIKALDYKPFYDSILHRIEQQLIPIRFKTVN